MNFRIGLIVSSIAALFLLAGKADAYVDPGSVSMVLQIVFAAVVGTLFTIRGTIAGIFKRFRRGAPDRPPDAK